MSVEVRNIVKKLFHRILYYHVLVFINLGNGDRYTQTNKLLLITEFNKTEINLNWKLKLLNFRLRRKCEI